MALLRPTCLSTSPQLLTAHAVRVTPSVISVRDSSNLLTSLLDPSQWAVLPVQLVQLAYLEPCLQVHEAASKLTATPASPEEFADLLSFLEKLERRRRGLDEAYDHVCSPLLTLLV